MHHPSQSQLGIVFVLMKKNIHEVRKLVEAANFYGINEIKITHLIPYDEESEKQVCYRLLSDKKMFRARNRYQLHVDMPLLDPSDVGEFGILPLFADPKVTYSLLEQPVVRQTRSCRFIRDGCAFVRWDGVVSPCVALLHNNHVFQKSRVRSIKHHGFSNVESQPLGEIYDSEPYRVFRERVESFSFSPCTDCYGCDDFTNNEIDCIESPFPTCGGCLWSEGLFQCP